MKKLLYSFVGFIGFISLIGLNEVNSVIHKKQSFSSFVVSDRTCGFI